MFATAFYLVVDLNTGKLSYASAAHPDPMQFHRQPDKSGLPGNNLDGGKGPALGLFQAATFPTCRRQIDTGDLIMLFTDGLIEAEGSDQKMFSREQLIAAVQKRAGLPTKKMFSRVLAEIRKFSGHNQFDDDVCLVGIEVKPLKSR
jgi:serine phosphatase RsbU (regulator of sigma subunit)